MVLPRSSTAISRSPVPFQRIFHPKRAGDSFNKFSHRMTLAGSDHKIVRLLLLEDRVHDAYIVACISPVPPRAPIAERKAFLQTELYLFEGNRDFSSYEMFPASRGLMIKKDAGTNVETAALSIRLNDGFVSTQFRFSVWTHRLKG